MQSLKKVSPSQGGALGFGQQGISSICVIAEFCGCMICAHANPGMNIARTINDKRNRLIFLLYPKRMKRGNRMCKHLKCNKYTGNNMATSLFAHLH